MYHYLGSVITRKNPIVVRMNSDSYNQVQPIVNVFVFMLSYVRSLVHGFLPLVLFSFGELYFFQKTLCCADDKYSVKTSNALASSMQQCVVWFFYNYIMLLVDVGG